MRPAHPDCEVAAPGCQFNEVEWRPVADALAKLGLSTLHGVKSYRGEVLKNHKGSRDVLRLTVTDTEGRPRVLYLKRTWRPYKKDGLLSLFQRGRVWSVSRREWENSRALDAAGLKTAGLVALGEECGPLWEKFSFIITAEAQGTQTLERFLQTCSDFRKRRKVLDALALEIRKMHTAGLASPDLFTRHIFVDDAPANPGFCLIDMARLDQRSALTLTLRARDLAALNITSPLRNASVKERLRFLKVYAGTDAASLLPLIQARMKHLLRRRKFRNFASPNESADPGAAGLKLPPPSTTPKVETFRERVQP